MIILVILFILLLVALAAASQIQSEIELERHKSSQLLTVPTRDDRMVLHDNAKTECSPEPLAISAAVTSDDKKVNLNKLE